MSKTMTFRMRFAFSCLHSLVGAVSQTCQADVSDIHTSLCLITGAELINVGANFTPPALTQVKMLLVHCPSAMSFFNAVEDLDAQEAKLYHYPP